MQFSVVLKTPHFFGGGVIYNKRYSQHISSPAVVEDINAWWLLVFQWHNHLHGLFNARAIFVEKQQWYYLAPTCGRIRGFNTFLKGIFPKVNVIAWLEFEHANFECAVHFSHNTTWTSTHRIRKEQKKSKCGITWAVVDRISKVANVQIMRWVVVV